MSELTTVAYAFLVYAFCVYSINLAITVRIK